MRTARVIHHSTPWETIENAVPAVLMICEVRILRADTENLAIFTAPEISAGIMALTYGKSSTAPKRKTKTTIEKNVRRNRKESNACRIMTTNYIL